MTRTQAGKRVWSPRGRPKSPARHNGYSHAEGGVATSYAAFGAFRAHANSGLKISPLFVASLIATQQSVAQVTVPGTQVRNVATSVDPALRLVEFQRADEVSTGILWVLGLWMRITIAMSAVGLVLTLAGIYAACSRRQNFPAPRRGSRLKRSRCCSPTSAPRAP